MNLRNPGNFAFVVPYRVEHFSLGWRAAKTVAVVCFLLAGALGQTTARTGPQPGPPAFACTKRIVANDWTLLFANIKVTNPDAYKRMVADPEIQKKQVENLRKLLAFSCQAVNDGALKDPVNREEVENIRSEIVAIEFDKIHDKRASHTQFDYITDERVAGFYKITGNQTAFDEFLNDKLELLKRSGSGAANREVTADEREQARQYFAKIRLSEADSKLKARAFEPSFWSRMSIQVKLQQAQFLAKLASEKIADKAAVAETDIDQYIKTRPEFDLAAKQAKAEGILARAKAGEDFASLANEFSEDPGNGDEKGVKHGGLYTGVREGVMIPSFEAAALALEPGEVSPVVVETDFGYHIIKLGKKADVKQPDGTSIKVYDVRHILISTTQKDPSDPMAHDVPIRQFVRAKLESQKENEIVAQVVAANPVEIAAIPIT
ncbi:MAG: peptidylprolyl isomerase, partial [Candidatus Binatia bacterium]